MHNAMAIVNQATVIKGCPLYLTDDILLISQIFAFIEALV